MSLKTFKMSYYCILIILIILFFTKDLNLAKDKFYRNIKKVKNPNDILVLVNKQNKLDKNDKANDLEMLDTKYANENKLLRKEAKINIENLIKEAQKDGFDITVVSAYRSFDYQKMLFTNYVKNYSKKYALSCSAKAGHSEHQTGLAVDVMGENKDYNLFEETKEMKWMSKNAHKYGFILRYPKGKENITGFKYEPWHYRYVGVEAATEIYEKNITLEEYLKEKYEP
jgi:D-alanyl-D-alanine carboxypeptidase